MYTWIDDFPINFGATKIMGPETVLLVKSNTDYNNKNIIFGAYNIVYTSNTNNMKRRSVHSIVLT